MSADPRPLTAPDLLALKASGRRIVMLTCYDATFAGLLQELEVDVLLVGDSVNQVVAGQETTLSATLDQMIYHASAVRRGAPRALLFVDLPFLTYQVSISEAILNAGRVLQHGTLLAKVWGREYVDEVDYVRVYIRRLRDKLGDDPENPRYIRTERRLGYRFLVTQPPPDLAGGGPGEAPIRGV